MPASVSLDLKQLVRVCLNDPDLKAEVEAALAEGPLPVLTPCVHVTEGAQTFQVMLKSDRNKSPGDGGFIARDNLGWLSGRLSEVVKSEADASTVSAEEMAKRMDTAKRKGE